MTDWTITLATLDKAVLSPDFTQDEPGFGLRMNFTPQAEVSSGSAATHARARIEAFEAAIAHASRTSMDNYYSIKVGDEVVPTMTGESLTHNLPRLMELESRLPFGPPQPDSTQAPEEETSGE